MDSILKQHRITKVDFIKIDAEGSEFEILKGMKETLRDFKPNIIVEVWFNERFDTILSYVEKYGYHATLISNSVGSPYYLLQPRKII